MNTQLGLGTTVLVNARESIDTTKWLYWLSLQQSGLGLFQYGSWVSTATTTFSVNTPIPLVWDVCGCAAGFTTASGNTTIAPTYAGAYMITVSLEVQKLAGSGANGAVYMWIETVGGVQVPYSTQHIDVPTGETAALDFVFILPLNAGQSFRAMVASDVNTISLVTLPATTTPYSRPVTPSARLSVHFVGLI